VWVAALYQPFEIAILAGIVSGMTISFVLSKWFTFGSRSWERTPGEVGRFLLVYSVGCAVYWSVAMITKTIVSIYGFAPTIENAISVFLGAGTMMFTSYFGHRFFTYRTHKRVEFRVGAES
jgi:putative flippase GtrA